MWRKHQSVYQDHLKYVRNGILKLFRVGILCYAERVMYIQDLDKYLPPLIMKGEIYEAANWKVSNQELMVSEIHAEIKDGPHSSM